MIELEKIPTRPNMGRAFISHDPRNRDFPIRALLGEALPLREKVWRRGGAYDQGQDPHCVAYEGKGKLNTAPFSAFEDYDVRSRYSTDAFYAGAQANDQWPGTDYDGTSAQGMLAHLTQQQIVSEYRWCFGIDDVLATLSHHGPVGVGAWWRGGMWDPDSENHLVSYSGSYDGGHQFEAIGIHPDVEEVEFMNSWGTSWGDRGRFRMKFDQFALLLDDNADVHTLVTVN
jgi:hypothetical protein